MGHADDDIEFYGTIIGIVEDYHSESATEAGGSESEDESAPTAVEDTSAAYVMSLEQENESLKQINLNLQDVSVTLAACRVPAWEL